MVTVQRGYCSHSQRAKLPQPDPRSYQQQIDIITQVFRIGFPKLKIVQMIIVVVHLAYRATVCEVIQEMFHLWNCGCEIK